MARATLDAMMTNPWFRWARRIQWFGLAALLGAVLLGAFTDLRQTPSGIMLIAVIGMLGVLSLIPARFILTAYLMRREQTPTEAEVPTRFPEREGKGNGH